MIVADILFYFLIILGFYLVFQSYWLAAEALFPRLIERCRRKYVFSPWFSLFCGLLFTFPVMTIGVLLATRMGNGLLQIGGLFCILLLLLFGLIGSAGLCRQIGAGLSSPYDETQPWRRVFRGGAILGLTFVMPVLGWFAVLPLVLISGVGVYLRALWSRDESN